MSATVAPPPASAVAVATQEGGPATHRWEASAEATWDTAVQEDADGNIISRATQSMADAIRQRRKRLEQTDYSQKRKRVVRDMIRYMYVVVDASRWMRTKDPVLPPGSRLDVTLNLLQEFVQEFYDQNPLSHLGFIVLRDGEAEILSQLSSNSKGHKVALQSFGVMAASDPKGGECSLQNGLEVAGRSLGHQPRHGSREIVILLSALSTCDPGSLLTDTLPRLQLAGIRVSALALAAELHVCRKLAEETGGVMGVCLDKGHYRDWLLGGQCTPPPTSVATQERGCDMVRMGFPTRTSTDVPTLVHATRDTKLLARTSYLCPQCQAKQSDLPTDCVVCGLKLVLAPHLARSFHHLFPVPPFAEVPIAKSLIADETKAVAQPVISLSANTVVSSGIQIFRMDDSLVADSKDFDRSCFACMKLIGTMVVVDSSTEKKNKKKNGMQRPPEEILRFQCPACMNVFCADCDAYLHETLHNCPGCLSKGS